MKIFFLVGVLFLTVSCFYSQSVSTNCSDSKEISEEEAIKVAENFIIENGYTDLSPNSKEIVFESIERIRNIEKILKSRQNTLEKRAYGILSGRTGSSKGFTVVFLYVDKFIERTGRAVVMDLDGKNVKVEHKDIFLKAVEKKL